MSQCNNKSKISKNNIFLHIIECCLVFPYIHMSIKMLWWLLFLLLNNFHLINKLEENPFAYIRISEARTLQHYEHHQTYNQLSFNYFECICGIRRKEFLLGIYYSMKFWCRPFAERQTDSCADRWTECGNATEENGNGSPIMKLKWKNKKRKRIKWIWPHCVPLLAFSERSYDD